MAGHDSQQPSPWVARFSRIFSPENHILDVAAGAGRHCRPLLARGCRITAVDIDISGLADLRAQADIVQMDLETGAPWPFQARQFDGILVCNYLYRPHLEALIASVAENGLLIYETFGQGNERYGRPSNPDFLLRPGELLEVMPADMQVLAYHHGIVDTPAKAVRQAIVAHRSQSPIPLPA